MSHRDIHLFRFLTIGLLLVLPTAAIVVWLLWQGVLPAGMAVAAVVFVAAPTWLVLRLIVSDARLLAEQIERLAEAQPGEPVAAVTDGSATAQALTGALNRARARWIERLELAAQQVAAGEAMLEALHDPLILVERDRRVLHANKAARDLFGERMAGRDLAVSLRNPAVLEAVDGVLAGGTSRSVELVLPVPVERTLETRVKPFQQATLPSGGSLSVGSQSGGTLSGGDAVASANGRAALVSLHDITLLKRSEQMRADFVANASHELRTPLSTLLGFIETLRGPARDDADARDRFLGIMYDQAGRMSRLVNDLLSLSRIELDEHSPPTGPADLDDIVRHVAAVLELKAAARKIRLRVEGPDVLPSVLGDEDQLTQVFQNLIDNAIKYGRENTDVVVTLAVNEPAARLQPAAGGVGDGGAMAAIPALPGRRRTGRTVSVAVTDRGEGIPRTHLPRLTERFYRVDPARSRALGGTGLGLAIVKHIVNRHRGRLTIDSEVGKGSTFTVHLPAAPPDDAAALRPSTPAPYLLPPSSMSVS